MIKKLGKIVGIYAAIYLLCSVVFVLLFHTPLFRSMEVLMYRGIVFILMTGILAAILMVLCKQKWESLFDFKDVILMFLGFCCVNMVLFTLIPVTVERSVSVFTLSYMEENPGAYTVEDMEKIFQEKYVCEFKAFDKRFTEQIVSGNVEETEEGYVLNERGKFTVKFFRAISSLFHTDERLIYPNENSVENTESNSEKTADK
jgi:hypothetical protein